MLQFKMEKKFLLIQVINICGQLNFLRLIVQRIKDTRMSLVNVNVQSLIVFGDGTKRIQLFQNTSPLLNGQGLFEAQKMVNKYLLSLSVLRNLPIWMSTGSVIAKRRISI